MILKFKTKTALISTAIILTLFLTWLVGSFTERDMRKDFLIQTQIAANSIDVNHVKQLTGTLADLKSPDYLQLKQQFANIRKVDERMYFVYLMGVKKNGNVFFYVDDKPDEHPEGSSPGSPYNEAPGEFKTVMQTGIATVEGPSADSWGSFASGCAPIIDPKTGKTIAIFAIDFTTSFWYWEIVLRSALPVGLLIVFMFGIFSYEISIRKGNLLIKSEEKYRFMFNNNPQPNWIYDHDTLSFLEVNETAIQHYGYSREEFLSMTLKDIRPVEDIPLLLEDIDIIRNSYNNAGEWRHVKKNGELIFVEIISHTVIFNGRNARHVLVHDVTGRKLAENALKQANNELERLHNNLNDAIFSIDSVQNKMLYASKAHQSVFGYLSTEFIKNPHLWHEIIVAEDKQIFDDRLSSLANGKNLNIEYRIADPNGQIRWIEAKMNPTFDENGNLSRIDGIASDITQRKRIEVELLESEINFHRSISDSPLGIRIVTVTGETIFTNKAFLDIFELKSMEDFVNKSAKKMYTPESYLQHELRKEKRINGEEVNDYEISIICGDQRIRHVKVSRNELLWNGTKHFQIISQDITEQRNAEEQLRKLSIAVVQSPDAICITDPDGFIEYVNPRTIELSGFSFDELINENARIFSSGEKPKEEYAQLWQTIKSGNIWSGELHNKKKNGELYWESTSISPIFNKENQITHFLSIKEDVTERKLADIALSNSEEQLRKFASHLQNVREEEKVALAREIHDDLGQILVALKIDMGLLKNRVVKSNTSIGSEAILAKFDNMVALIDKTIKTARRIMDGLRPELIELHGFVGAATFYLGEFEDRHQITCKFISEIPEIKMNSQQSLAFFRILQEALNNIAKHSKATFVKINLRKKPNKLILEIIDNGIGFDKNNSGRQDSYGMIGMKERVVLLGGELDIRSEVGSGTIVKVKVPYINK